MTRLPRLRVAWIYAKHYTPAVMAAGLMYGGIHQIISFLKYPVANCITKIVNAGIIRGFRDRLPLPEYGGLPWQFSARGVAVAAMVLVVGIFFGIWANVRSQRRPTP